ncbi:MAG: FAD-dependent oxidoreductase, partial [Propionicimonas sp.]|nr:FAD-dependent oxidoreductase [Propionicimonas sp.]
MRVAVIGAGHNGLVAGLELARAGVDVVVLEQDGQAGGCLWTERTASGVLVERGAFEHGGVAGLAEDLGLAAFGLRYADHPLLAGTVFGDGEQRLFDVDLDRTVAALGPDAGSYRELAGLAGAVFGVLDGFGGVPPTLTQAAAALAGLRGGDALFRTLVQPAELVIASAVGDPHTRAALELYAAHGQVPPWSPGSGMFGLLLPSMHGGRAVRPVGGSAMLTGALAAALSAAGGRLLVDTPVTGLRPAGRGAVVTVPGEQFSVDAVVAAVDVRRVAALVEDVPAALLGSIADAHSGHFNVAELTVSIVTGPLDAPGPLRADPDAVWFVQD